MKRILFLFLALILIVGAIFIPVISEHEEEQQTSSLIVTKKLSGEIWHIRCDYMDGETFTAGGGIWKRDVIKNPEGNLSREGHRSNKCGDAEHWVIWVGTDGVPYRMDEIKSGATGGTLPTIVYRPRYELSTSEIMSLDPSDPDLVWKYSQNFIDLMEWSDIQIGQRLYWTTQNGNQVWYHTGIPYKAIPTFVIYVNGTGYPLIAGESVEINDLLPGIYDISEDSNPDYYLGEVTSSGEITGQEEWTVSLVINEGENVYVDWENIVLTPPPDNSPTPPGTPEVTTPTPSPTPTPTPTPSPSPTPGIELYGYKVWNDEEDADSIRPSSVTVSLYANGQFVESVNVAASEDDEVSSMWSYYFGYYPEVDENGDKIEYTVVESPVDEYSVQYRGMNVINVHETYTPTPVITETPTPTPTPTETPTEAPTDSPTPVPTNTPTTVPTDTPTSVPTATPTVEPTTTPTSTPSPTPTPTYTPTPTPTATPTPTSTPTTTPTQTPTPTPTPKPRSTSTPTAVPVPAGNYVPKKTATPTATATPTTAPTRAPATRPPIPEVPKGYPKPNTPSGQFYIIEDYDTSLGIPVLLNHVGDCFD